MMPVQKVLNVYKSSMDLKEKGSTRTYSSESQKSDSNKDNKSDAKKSFQLILNKAMQG